MNNCTRPCSFPLQRRAFTLAEVLITLVIVGVVVALTIPVTVAKYHEQQTIQALKVTYSSFAQAFRKAEAENGPIETWDLVAPDSSVGAWNIYNNIIPALSILKTCGKSADCFADNYLTLQGDVTTLQPKNHPCTVRGMLSNGVSFAVWSNGVCNGGFYSDMCGILDVDINGYKKPNRFGYDYFSFKITPNGLIPYGTSNSELTFRCSVGSGNRENGKACSAWVLYKNNFDYKKQNVSW